MYDREVHECTMMRFPTITPTAADANTTESLVEVEQSWEDYYGTEDEEAAEEEVVQPTSTESHLPTRVPTIASCFTRLYVEYPTPEPTLRSVDSHRFDDCEPTGVAPPGHPAALPNLYYFNYFVAAVYYGNNQPVHQMYWDESTWYAWITTDHSDWPYGYLSQFHRGAEYWAGDEDTLSASLAEQLMADWWANSDDYVMPKGASLAQMPQMPDLVPTWGRENNFRPAWDIYETQYGYYGPLRMMRDETTYFWGAYGEWMYSYSPATTSSTSSTTSSTSTSSTTTWSLEINDDDKDDDNFDCLPTPPPTWWIPPTMPPTNPPTHFDPSGGLPVAWPHEEGFFTMMLTFFFAPKAWHVHTAEEDADWWNSFSSFFLDAQEFFNEVSTFYFNVLQGAERKLVTYPPLCSFTVLMCDDGTYAVRNPANNCAFGACLGGGNYNEDTPNPTPEPTLSAIDCADNGVETYSVAEEVDDDECEEGPVGPVLEDDDDCPDIGVTNPKARAMRLGGKGSLAEMSDETIPWSEASDRTRGAWSTMARKAMSK